MHSFLNSLLHPSCYLCSSSFIHLFLSDFFPPSFHPVFFPFTFFFFSLHDQLFLYYHFCVSCLILLSLFFQHTFFLSSILPSFTLLLITFLHPSFPFLLPHSFFHPVVHHLSPQALKWKEYRRKNPLGVERCRAVCSSSPSSSSSCLSASAARRRTVRRNVFDFPPSHQALNFSRLHGAETHLVILRGHISGAFNFTACFK